MKSKEEWIVLDSINEYNKNKEDLFKEIYGKKYKYYTGKFSWGHYLRYILVYIILLFSYNIVFFIHSHSRDIYEYFTTEHFSIKIRLFDSLIPEGRLWSFDIILISIVLFISAFVLLLPKMYSYKGKKAQTLESDLNIHPIMSQFWYYRLLYQQQVINNRLAWLTIVTVCLVLAIAYINSDNADYPVVDSYSAKEGHWTEKLPNLVKFGLPIYHPDDIERLERIILQESKYTTYLPMLDNLVYGKGYYGFYQLYSIIEYWIIAKIVITNIVMSFFLVELFVLLPLLIKEVDTKFKHLFILFLSIIVSILIINTVIDSVEELKWFNAAVILIWIIVQVPLYFIANPLMFFKLKSINLLLSKLLCINRALKDIVQIVKSDEFSFIKSIFVKLGFISRFSENRFGLNLFRMIPYVLYYIPILLLIIFNTFVYYRFSFLVSLLILQILLLFNLTKRINLPSQHIKSACLLVEDNYNLSPKIMDYIMHFKCEYLYNRLALIIVISVCLVCSLKQYHLVDLYFILFTVMFMIVDIIIIQPFIFPFIDTRIKHIAFIIVTGTIFYYFAWSNLSHIYLIRASLAIVWLLTMFVRNLVLVNEIDKFQLRSKEKKKSRPAGRLD